MLTNIHDAPTEGNFLNVHGNVVKSLIMKDYNPYVDYVDNSDKCKWLIVILKVEFCGKRQKKIFTCWAQQDTLITQYLFLGAKMTHI